jgi:hypothetical protein
VDHRSQVAPLGSRGDHLHTLRDDAEGRHVRDGTVG